MLGKADPLPLTNAGPEATVFLRTSIGESCRLIKLMKCLDRQFRLVVDLSADAICDKRFFAVTQIKPQAHDPRCRVPFLDMVEAFSQQLPHIRD